MPDPFLRFRCELPILEKSTCPALTGWITSDADLESCFESIDEIRESKSWRRWQSRPAILT